MDLGDTAQDSGHPRPLVGGTVFCRRRAIISSPAEAE